MYGAAGRVGRVPVSLAVLLNFPFSGFQTLIWVRPGAESWWANAFHSAAAVWMGEIWRGAATVYAVLASGAGAALSGCR
ncbi:Uncharacterised protein [Mycobacteroides abscessus subsp. abscessus]|nr:Uncharacterised protein [Mycobacteroides abscessus subsp. abscessus]